ncbi:MAG TPA: hypothetical protein VKM55_13135 [Candidatus Lokiarchaeia archaeon]|nr:hypothetical protein [Candidatus Lokiarchaeia archaeon]
MKRVDASQFKQPKYLISFIIIANVLWGLIILFALPIFQGPDPYAPTTSTNEYASLIIVFIRFLFSGVIMLGIIAVQIAFNSIRAKQEGRHQLSYFQTSWQDIKNYLFARNNSFSNMHRLWYIFILAVFGVTINVATYFIGLNELPVVIMLTGAPSGFIILVSVYDAVKGKEKFTYFNGLYIFLIFLSIILIILAQAEGSENISKKDLAVGLIALFLNIASMFVNFVYVGHDAYADEERILQKPRTGNYRLIRTLTKLTLYFLFGALGTVLSIPICLILPVPYINSLAIEFMTRFWYFLSGAYFWQLAVLVVACTVMPNLLIFLASAWWDVESQFTFESWNSILLGIENLTSIIAAFLAGYSKVEPLLLLLTIIVLIVAIFLRFVHERDAKINVILYLRSKECSIKSAINIIASLHEIRKFFYITGRADIMIKATFGSTREFYGFLSRISLERNFKILWEDISFVEKIDEGEG